MDQGQPQQMQIKASDETVKSKRVIIFVISLSIWLWSLFLPGFTDSLGEVHLGSKILSSGWLGAFLLNFAWYGNVAWAFSLVHVLRQNYKNALYSSTIAVALGSTSVGVYFGLPTDFEAATGTAFLGVGWIIWMLALVIPGVFAYRVFEKLEGQEKFTLKNIATTFVWTFSLGIAPAVFIFLYNLLPLV